MAYVYIPSFTLHTHRNLRNTHTLHTDTNAQDTTYEICGPQHGPNPHQTPQPVRSPLYGQLGADEAEEQHVLEHGRELPDAIRRVDAVHDVAGRGEEEGEAVIDEVDGKDYQKGPHRRRAQT